MTFLEADKFASCSKFLANKIPHLIELAAMSKKTQGELIPVSPHQKDDRTKVSACRLVVVLLLGRTEWLSIRDSQGGNQLSNALYFSREAKKRMENAVTKDTVDNERRCE